MGLGRPSLQLPNIGAAIIRIKFWGPLYYNYNKEPSKIVLVLVWAPILTLVCKTLGRQGPNGLFDVGNGWGADDVVQRRSCCSSLINPQT